MSGGVSPERGAVDFGTFSVLEKDGPPSRRAWASDKDQQRWDSWESFNTEENELKTTARMLVGLMVVAVVGPATVVNASSIGPAARGEVAAHEVARDLVGVGAGVELRQQGLADELVIEAQWHADLAGVRHSAGGCHEHR